MNVIASIETKTMSSLEVAELTGKRHDHVLRDIRKMITTLEAGKEVSPTLGWHCESDSYLDSQGKPQVMYRMDKETTLTLLSGYDTVARHKIIQRWQLLEAEKQSNALPMTPMELLVQQMQQLVVIGQSMVTMQREMVEVKQDVAEIKQIQKDAEAELLALPAPTEPMADVTKENQIIRLVNAYAKAKAIVQAEVWRSLYTELLYRYRISVNAHKRLPNESKIQMLKRLGHIDKLYIIATNMLQIAVA